MLSRLFGRNRRDPRAAAEDLMNRLDERASLVVDDALVAEIGLGRRALYRLIYEMVRRERMFMLADRDDRMLLMTNTEFNRFMFRRSGKTEELPMLTLDAMRVEAEPETMEELEPGLVLCVEGDSEPVLEGRASEILDSAWIAAAVPAGTELPEHRQSLPERRREPWAFFEDAGRE